MVHGRSQLVESLVWLTPFLCVKRKEKREKEEREDERENVFFPKSVSRPSNPPDESAQHVSKKKTPSDELFLHISSKFQNLTVFSIIHMIRVRFFGPKRTLQR